MGDELSCAMRKNGWILGGLIFAATFAGGLGITHLTNASAESAGRIHYEICSMRRTNCVVDGDTVWIDGEKIRIADIDTPEIGDPKCDWEYDQGIKARDRLQELMNSAPFEVRPIGTRDEDRYGRKLRVLVSDGHSLGDVLVSEGLARTWSGRREPWC